jgi:hypothetical protein
MWSLRVASVGLVASGGDVDDFAAAPGGDTADFAAAPRPLRFLEEEDAPEVCDEFWVRSSLTWT